VGETVPHFSIMLSYLDPILFPDEIEVLEVSPNRYVYPIFKNGSRSLFGKDYKQLSKEEIFDLKHVEVFVREPFDRYVGGVQSYLSLRPELDRATTLQLIRECLFLDRHFCLQFHWLVNLHRFCDPWMEIKSVSELGTVTDLVWNTMTRDQSLIDYFQPNLKLWYYLQLDKLITEDFVGHTVKFSMIVAHLKLKYPDVHAEIIQRSQNLCSALD
jgi:hypothetical protein